MVKWAEEITNLYKKFKSDYVISIVDCTRKYRFLPESKGCTAESLARARSARARDDGYTSRRWTSGTAFSHALTHMYFVFDFVPFFRFLTLSFSSQIPALFKSSLKKGRAILSETSGQRKLVCWCWGRAKRLTWPSKNPKNHSKKNCVKDVERLPWRTSVLMENAWRNSLVLIKNHVIFNLRRVSRLACSPRACKFGHLWKRTAPEPSPTKRVLAFLRRGFGTQ